MAVNTRTIETEQARTMLVRYIEAKQFPFVVTVTDGKKRSTPQNDTMHLWFVEAASQLGDRTAGDVKKYCKLHFGVPILRERNEAFRHQYDRIVKPLAYEAKLELMGEPISFPISRLMSTKDAADYMTAIHENLSAQGIVLTEPDQRGIE